MNIKKILWKILGRCDCGGKLKMWSTHKLICKSCGESYLT